MPIVTVLLSFACALAAFFRVRSGEIINQDIYTWIESGNLSVSVGFLVDQLTAVMLNINRGHVDEVIAVLDAVLEKWQ